MRIYSIKSLILAIAIGFGAQITTAEAAAMRIDCPLPEVTRTIEERLPGDWWHTPAVFGFLRANIQELASGRTILVCDYSDAGRVVRYHPEGMACIVAGRGFDCTSAGVARSTPPIHSSNPIDWKQTYVMNFDSGRVESEGGDIWFQAADHDEYYLHPINGAEISLAGHDRGYNGCNEASYSGRRVPLRDAPVGTWVCVKTNEGRISQFRINELRGGVPRHLIMAYTTWARR